MTDVREIKSCYSRAKNNLKTESWALGWCYCRGMLSCHGNPEEGAKAPLKGWWALKDKQALKRLGASGTFQEWTAFTVINMLLKRDWRFLSRAWEQVPDNYGDHMSFKYLVPFSPNFETPPPTTDPSLGNGVMKPIFEQILNYKVLKFLWVVQVVKLFYRKHLFQ